LSIVEDVIILENGLIVGDGEEKKKYRVSLGILKPAQGFV